MSTGLAIIVFLFLANVIIFSCIICLAAEETQSLTCLAAGLIIIVSMSMGSLLMKRAQLSSCEAELTKGQHCTLVALPNYLIKPLNEELH